MLLFRRIKHTHIADRSVITCGGWGPWRTDATYIGLHTWVVGQQAVTCTDTESSVFHRDNDWVLFEYNGTPLLQTKLELLSILTCDMLTYLWFAVQSIQQAMLFKTWYTVCVTCQQLAGPDN